MNKKGEIFLGTILLVILILGIFVYEKDIEEKKYLGDKSTMIFYYVESTNPKCNVFQLKINKENVVLFRTIEEAKENNFKLDENCN